MMKYLILFLVSFNVLAYDKKDSNYVIFKNSKNPVIILKTYDDDKPITYSYNNVKVKNNVAISKEQFKHLYDLYFGNNYEN